MLYTGINRQQLLCIKIKSVSFLFLLLWNVQNCEVKERVEEWLRYIHRGFFFILLSQDWHMVNSKHLIISTSMFFSFRAFAKYPFFLLGSYPLSTLVSLFIYISSTFISLFYLTSLHYLKAFNHFSFLILVSLVQPRSLYLSTLHRLVQG